MTRVNIEEISMDQARHIRKDLWGMNGSEFADKLNETLKHYFPIPKGQNRNKNMDKSVISRRESGIEKIPPTVARAYHVLERIALVGGMQKVKSRHLPCDPVIDDFWEAVLHKQDDRAERQALMALRGGPAEYPNVDPDVWTRLSLDLGIFYWIILRDMSKAKKMVVSALKRRPKSKKLKALIAYALIGMRFDSIDSSLSDEEKKTKGARLLQKLKTNCIDADSIPEGQYYMGAARISSRLLNDEEKFREYFGTAVRGLGLNKQRVYALLKRRADSKDFENACHFQWVKRNFLPSKQSK